MDWFGLLYFPVVVGLVWMFARTIIPAGWRSLRSYGWVQTRGIISQSDVEEIKATGQGTRYKMNIAYEYHVGDKTYTGDITSFTDWMFERIQQGRPKHTAKKLTDKYVPWQFVQVYYDPKNPAQATLTRGISVSYVLYATFMFWMTLAFLVTALQGLMALFGG